MWYTIRNLALATVVAPPPCRSPSRDRRSRIHTWTTTEGSPVLTTDRTLLASLERIWRGSPLWREAVAAVRRTGRHVLVATPADVVMTNRDQDAGDLILVFWPKLSQSSTRMLRYARSLSW